MTILPNDGAGLTGPQGPEAAAAAREAQAQQQSADQAASAGGPAFRALLEQLQQKATDLQETSRGVDDPAELKGAVDSARATLEDALSLGDRVLEAYRGAQLRQGNTSES